MARSATLRRLAVAVALGLGLLVAVLVWRTSRGAPQPRGTKAAPVAGPIDRQQAAETLAAAIRIETVSGEVAASLETLASLQGLLAARFPAAHGALRRDVADDGAALYTWSGTDERLEPIVLLAHQDVVPATAVDDWEHAPFAGDVAADFVWGRGTLDDKGSLIAILAAVERLAGRGTSPRRTVYLAFGPDEELSGRGAAAMAARLRAGGLAPALVLDEGLFVTSGLVPGVDRPVALVGVAEKGYATVDLDVDMDGGHSSMPAAESAIGVLARALARIEANPPPARVEGVAAAMFEVLGREMHGPARWATANLWLLRPLLMRALLESPSSAAMLRTTVAPTMLAAGVKENVLAPRARAAVNLRLLPGDTIAAAVDRLRSTVADDRVRLTLRSGALEASPISTVTGEGWTGLESAIRRVFPEAVVAPGLMIGATDARHWAAFSDRVYRFAPLHLRAEDLGRFHGTNERLAIEGLADAILFYELLLDDLAF